MMTDRGSSSVKPRSKTTEIGAEDRDRSLDRAIEDEGQRGLVVLRDRIKFDRRAVVTKTHDRSRG